MIEQGDGLGPGLERLYKRRAFGVKPGLDGIRALCDVLDHPERRFAAIHIAGTNGKGSVAAMLDAVLCQCGLHAGLYTSPHLVRFNERIRIDGKDVSDELLASSLDVCEKASAVVLEKYGYDCTFFEIATAMAFVCMREAGIRLAVIETGLGGRLDATNVVQPCVTVLTRIGMDHAQYLGNSLAEIAYEKAGIIKPACPVVSAPQEPDAEAVLRAVATKQQAPFLFASEVVSVGALGKHSPRGQEVHVSSERGLSGKLLLPLGGIHQIENLAVAIAAMERVSDALGVSVPIASWRKGLRVIRWPGRMQYWKQNVLLDAAHNADAASALVQSLQKQGWRNVVLVTGMCADKDTAAVAKILSTITVVAYCCPIPGGRTEDPTALASHYRRNGVDVKVADSPHAALRMAEHEAEQRAVPIVIAGSIFLVGAVLSAPLVTHP